MYLFYSVNASVAEVPNQMGSVSIFLEVYDDAEDYDVLNKLICQWRRVEEETRSECGMSSVSHQYSGCTNYNRRDRNLRTTNKATSMYDVVRNLEEAPEYKEPANLGQDDWEEPDMDWDEFIQDVYHREEDNSHGRHLTDYNNVDWFNFFGMLKVKTEYYFRYSG